ncbi:kinase-like domain-containing protein [Rhizophagus clarus]|uniref:Kinase-like domain-containing protein n=1 Tax=Rhizophagus clarus TaxID=94130 RepID=A0A8H3L9S5_9GLOM|nr:kinase-like domain-containing protein [Rhizophagus clarus]
MIVFSAVWRNGPLYYRHDKCIRDSNKEVALKFLGNSPNPTEFVINEVEKYLTKNSYTRDSNREVVLNFLCNSQNSTEFVIDEAKKYSMKNDEFHILYGISQDPDTNDYVLVQKNFTWIGKNEKIDCFIQERLLKINKCEDVIFEWIPFDQFNHIEKIGNNNLMTIYSAVWTDGPLYYQYNKYTRNSNKTVNLKNLHNSQNFIEFVINEAEKYITNNDDFFVLYGISQNPDTNDYVLVLNWSSGNDNIDNFIQERQLKINKQFEWIPYNRFNKIRNKGNGYFITVCSATWGYREVALLCYNVYQKFLDKIQESDNSFKLYGISRNKNVNDYILVFQNDYCAEYGEKYCKGGFSTVYSAMWKDGPLKYFSKEEMCIRTSNKKVALKCIDGSANLNDKFLNEVKEYSIKKMDDILNVYGISQVPTTKNFIIVLEYAEGGSYRDWMNKNYKDFDWKNRIQTLLSIIKGLKGIHQNEKVHHDLHPGNILFLTKNLNIFSKKSLFISDMGLCKDVDNTNEVKIYGVLPYTAPEVLRSEAYTKKADIYSFSMIMYFTATGKQPFINCAHDGLLALDICNGTRPEISEKEAPKCYIELMKRCWDSNPDNRPDVAEIHDKIRSLYDFCVNSKNNESYATEIRKQFKEAENYRKLPYSSFKKNKQHPQAIYTTRLLNPFTKDLQNSECLSCAITDN